MSLARRLGLTAEDAEDAVSQVFVDRLRHLPFRQQLVKTVGVDQMKLGATSDEVAKFWSSLYLHTLQRLLDIERKRKRRRENSLELGDDSGVGQRNNLADRSTANPCQQLEAEEEVLRVREDVGTLPPKFRSVILLFHFGQLSCRSIAACLDIPLNTVRSRLYAARKKLHSQLGLTSALGAALRGEDRAAALDSLPPEQRAILLLRYWDGMRLLEISHCLKMDLSSVLVLLRRSVQNLRKAEERIAQDT